MWIQNNIFCSKKGIQPERTHNQFPYSMFFGILHHCRKTLSSADFPTISRVAGFVSILWRNARIVSFLLSSRNSVPVCLSWLGNYYKKLSLWHIYLWYPFSCEEWENACQAPYRWNTWIQQDPDTMKGFFKNLLILLSPFMSCSLHNEWRQQCK
jgi:hypothetical protein